MDSQEKNLKIALLRHDRVVFEDQVVYLTGNAYFDCEFIRCTMVHHGGPFHLESPTIRDGCVWHIDLIIHDRRQAKELAHTLTDLIMPATGTFDEITPSQAGATASDPAKDSAKTPKAAGAPAKSKDKPKKK